MTEQSAATGRLGYIAAEALAARNEVRDLAERHDELRKLLLAVQLTEINGRLCARPEAPDPFFDAPSGAREDRCCPTCRDLWRRIDAALAPSGDNRGT